MRKILILQGIPASGKSTWAVKFVTENTTWVRVCRDDLRRMRGAYWLPEQEDLISRWEKHLVEDAIIAGYPVVLDATNLNLKYLKQWVKLAEFHQAEIEFKRFDISLEECLQRDHTRAEHVGEDVIQKMYRNYAKLESTMRQLKESGDEAFVVEKLVQDPTLPKAIICDLDGTLCLHNGRGAFEYHRCDEDLLHDPVAAVVRIFNQLRLDPPVDYTIIFLSGREDCCREKTLKWLKENKVWWNWKLTEPKLLMRATGDHRKDCIVKKEIFDREIKGKYFVEFCLDDRDQVVKLWRDMGLTCFQVNYGNF